jgi:hypothetical protein
MSDFNILYLEDILWIPVKKGRDEKLRGEVRRELKGLREGNGTRRDSLKRGNYGR